MTGFRIVNPLHLVRPRDERSPLTPALYGELADCPSRGCRIVRAALRGCFGNEVLTYWRVPDDASLPPEPLGGIGDEVASLTYTRDEMRSNPRKGVHRMEPSPIEREAARFAADYPLLAERLGITRAAPPRVFSPGPCFRQVVIDPRAGEIDFQAFMDLHVSGDFGENGTLADAALEGDEALWLAGLGDRATQNALALRSGGVVSSAYRLPDRPAKIHIGTAIGREHFSFVWVTLDPVA